MLSKTSKRPLTKNGVLGRNRGVKVILTSLLSVAAVATLTWFVPMSRIRETVAGMNRDDWAVVGVVIACFTFGVSQIWNILNMGRNSHQIRLQNRIEYQKLLFETNKMLMQNPFLQAMFDGHQHLLSQEIADRAKQQIQLEAYASYHVNLFEIVYVFFYDNQDLLTLEEREVYTAWMNWLGEVLKTSEVFCREVEKGIAERSYNQWFVEYVTEQREEYKAYLVRKKAGAVGGHGGGARPNPPASPAVVSGAS